MVTSEQRYATLPFGEAISYLQQRINLPTDSWRDISGDEADAFFMSAGAKGSLLSELRTAVDRAIEQGQRPEDFQGTFEKIAEGWTYRGSAGWRSRIILQTNLRAAYGRGREELQLDPEVLRLQPYLQYIHGGSGSPRPHHLALNGQVFTAGTLPWPCPAGYNCSCRYVSLSSRRLSELGLSPSTLKRGDSVDVLMPDGRTVRTTLRPDEGWDRQPGQARDARRQELIQRVIDRSPPAIARQIRKAIKGYKPPAKTVAVAPPPVVTPAAPTWPTDPDGLTVVRQLGGSTGAELVEDPATGRQFVRKRGANPDHLREEFTADNAYRALGVAVPEARLYDTANGPVKLAEFIQGRSLGDLTPTERQAAYRELRKDFVADAVMGNWDVVGLSRDNILIDATGKPWRIDNGGALRYRAQGRPKGDDWNDYPTELWSLRDPRRNQNTFEAFGDLKHLEMVAQIEALSTRRTDLINALPPELHDTINRRLDEAERVAKISRTLEADAFREGYIDQFTKHSLGLRASGIVDKLPTRFDLAAGNQLYDENGKLFDHLRDSGGPVEALEAYIDRSGGRYSLVSEYGGEQAEDSWNSMPKALKHHLAINRTIPDDQYYWGSRDAVAGRQDVARAYRNIVQDEAEWGETFAAFHAWNYEQLQRIDMPNNDRAAGTFRAVRTESENTMKRNGFAPGDTDLVMNRGGAESFSMFTKITANAGGEITVQNVPHHRVLGMYMQSSDSMGFSDMFLGDGENEMVVLPEGIRFDYVRRQDWKDATPNYKAVNPQSSGGGTTSTNSKNSSSSASPPAYSVTKTANTKYWLKHADLASVQKYWTLSEIKEEADVLGIKDADAKAFGKVNTKAAWIKALEALKPTL